MRVGERLAEEVPHLLEIKDAFAALTLTGGCVQLEVRRGKFEPVLLGCGGGYGKHPERENCRQSQALHATLELFAQQSRDGPVDRAEAPLAAGMITTLRRLVILAARMNVANDSPFVDHERDRSPAALLQ